MRDEDAKKLVAEGYDRVSRAYRSDSDPDAENEYKAWLEPIMKELPFGSSILDLGCGCGIPASRLLASKYAVVGIDISPVQIERARALVPHASFSEADMTAISFPAARFDAIVSFFAMIHVPLSKQPALIVSIHRWLCKSG